MCGIMAYIGNQEAYPIIADGLGKLEYRGYDSAGVAIMNGSLHLFKQKGKVKNLTDQLVNQDTSGYLGIGHTRWATHGLPNDTNAHPHRSQDGRLVMVHNGIIENYGSLKSQLQKQHYTFQSETDSEVLVQWISWLMSNNNMSLAEALPIALREVEGSYAIAIFDTYNPSELLVAKNHVPLVVGLNNEGFYVSSDVGPLSDKVERMFYLEDNNIARLLKGGVYELSDIEGRSLVAKVEPIKEIDDAYDLGDYNHYMHKEIMEQPDLIQKVIQENSTGHTVTVPAIQEARQHFYHAQRIIIVACGTSWHAGLIAEYLIEHFARIPVEVEYASEFRYRDPIIRPTDIVIGISQSGETADTLAAMQLAKDKGAYTYSIINTPNSSIARLSDSVTYLNIGREIGVASTKAFTAQVAVLHMVALQIAEIKKTVSILDLLQQMKELQSLPEKIGQVLLKSQVIESVATEIAGAENTLFLGRGINFPTALEGALKLKEISYIHAEGYPAAELKHGPIALIDDEMPVVVLATSHRLLSKVVSNIAEIKARGAKTIVVRAHDIDIPQELMDAEIIVPEICEALAPLIAVIPLQLLSYFIAAHRGCEIDQPRNLAKSVTVE